jgi:hypothetical protein
VSANELPGSLDAALSAGSASFCGGIASCGGASLLAGSTSAAATGAITIGVSDAEWLGARFESVSVSARHEAISTAPLKHPPAKAQNRGKRFASMSKP